MKQIIFTLLFASFSLTSIHAQIATTSSCDTNGDGKVDASDITNTINKVLDNGKATETTVIRLDDLTQLLARLSRLESQVKELRKLHNLFDTNGHTFVDLALPSGTKWATCNIGATNPEDFGDYFAWGETEPKSAYQRDTYKHYDETTGKYTKYCINADDGILDNKTILDLEDDAANVNWGGDWTVPTKENMQELIDNCEFTYTTINSIPGYEIKGTNGNTIFLPNAGIFTGKELDADGKGYYVTSNMITANSYSATYLLLRSEWYKMMSQSRIWGFSIRPVLSASK